MAKPKNVGTGAIAKIKTKAEERQSKLDAIFAKMPTNVKTTPKPGSQDKKRK